MRSLFAVASSLVDENNKYTKKVQVPQYIPSERCPNILELMNTTKYGKLISHINSSAVTEDEKKFLRFAASRHIIFNYSKIADYYAHATPEMQRLMEESALVIIDIDDAIANGYVKLSKQIQQIMEESGTETKNEE